MTDETSETVTNDTFSFSDVVIILAQHITDLRARVYGTDRMSTDDLDRVVAYIENLSKED